jgi:hypothetical protein
VPPQQRRRGDEERRPPRPGQHPRQRRQHDPVARFEVGAADLPTQHGNLVAQDEDLHLVGGITAPAQHQQPQHITQKSIHQEQAHPQILPDRHAPAVQPDGRRRRPVTPRQGREPISIDV